VVKLRSVAAVSRVRFSLATPVQNKMALGDSSSAYSGILISTKNLYMTYILLVIVAILAFLISSGLLLGISKVFKITVATYKKSMLITLLSGIAQVIITFILGLVGVDTLGQILAVVATFFIFSYLFKKYYQVSWKKSLGVYIANIIVGTIIALVIVVPIRLFVAEPFVVAGQSMSPHLNQGDFLIINKFDRTYERGDVVVFRSTVNNAYFIKRIIGLPSEKVQIKNGKLFINGNSVEEKFIALPIQGNVEVTLAPDEYFVLSDNSAPSLDSRMFGPIKASDIVGKERGN
jgi:signal peptidase I